MGLHRQAPYPANRLRPGSLPAMIRAGTLEGAHARREAAGVRRGRLRHAQQRSMPVVGFLELHARVEAALPPRFCDGFMALGASRA